MAYPNNFYNPYGGNQFVPLAQQTYPMQQMNNPISKVVDSMESVRGADIPMDGQAYYFPKADGSMVYSKRWLPNCTTQIMAYTPVNDTQPNSLPNDNIEGLKSANLGDTDLNQRMISIEEKIDNIEKLLSTKTNTARKVAKDES